MTIHTDTFPLVCQHAANNPQLAIRVTVKAGKHFAELVTFTAHGEEAVAVTCLFTDRQLERLHLMPQPVKINLVDNHTFKHLLERLHPGEGVML